MWRKLSFNIVAMRSGEASYSIILRGAQEGNTTLQVLSEGMFMLVPQLHVGQCVL